VSSCEQHRDPHQSTFKVDGKSLQHSYPQRTPPPQLNCAWQFADHLKSPWTNNFITTIANIQDTVGGYNFPAPVDVPPPA